MIGVRKLEVKFKKLSPDAKVPFRKHKGDAGFDMFASKDLFLAKGVATYTFTDIAFKIPKGYYCEIHGRSSLNKQGIICIVGIVDNDYHGEVSPVLLSTQKDYQIKKWDRVGQLIFKRRIDINFKETTKELNSDRGTKGFGSTGR